MKCYNIGRCWSGVSSIECFCFLFLFISWWKILPFLLWADQFHFLLRIYLYATGFHISNIFSIKWWAKCCVISLPLAQSSYLFISLNTFELNYFIIIFVDCFSFLDFVFFFFLLNRVSLSLIIQLTYLIDFMWIPVNSLVWDLSTIKPMKRRQISNKNKEKRRRKPLISTIIHYQSTYSMECKWIHYIEC